MKTSSIISFLLIIILIGGALVSLQCKETGSLEIAENTWAGFKYYFIDENGKAKRPKEADTVSEAQAYAMLRAAWMNDKETFDKCYRWSENNLSRKTEAGDNLLAWRWKDGRVLDWMPASDADIDYALSLIFAEAKWKGQAPEGLENYGVQAKKILKDILGLETYSTASGRLYLSPWIILNKGPLNKFPVNPSYYSPAHFRIFYEFTKDKRWLELVNTTYFMLDSLAKEFNNQKGVGLIPDWCSVDNQNNFYPLEGKNSGFGWEAVRVPIRVALDYLWFKSAESKEFFGLGFSSFIEKQWEEDGEVFCEYSYDGRPVKKYENPLFYAAYCCALQVSNSEYYKNLLGETNSFLQKDKNYWVYLNQDEYFVNSLAWIAEGINSGVVKNLF